MLTPLNNLLRLLLNKETFVFLALLTLSAASWVAVTLREEDKKDLHIPVQLTDVPKGKVVIDPDIDTINVRISDQIGSLIWHYGMNRTFDREPLELSFKKYNRGGEVSVSGAELQRLVQQRLQPSTSIVSFKRDRMVFRYCDGAAIRVPVKVKTSEGYYDLYNITVTPDTVNAYATPDKINELIEAYTEEVELPEKRVGDFMRKVPLRRIDGVRFGMSEVTVKGHALKLIEKTLDIPITCVNEPQGVKLRLFPSTLTVTFQVDMKLYKNVNEADFTAVVDYKDTNGQSTENVEVRLESMPNFVRNVSQKRKSVGFLVEER